MMLNLIPKARTIRDWLFSAEPSIFKPVWSFKGLSKAFYTLGDPKKLQKIVQEEEPEYPQLTIMG